MANIFNISWNNVVENLTPSFWRKTKTEVESKLIAYLRSVIAPVQDISDDLYSLQQDTFSFLNYSGQHLALENYLNDLYDNTLRRIFITENNASGRLIDLYLQSETDPSPQSVYLQSETNSSPFSFYLQSESINTNFTINIPAAITFDSTVVNRQVKNYSEASKTFNIVTF